MSILRVTIDVARLRDEARLSDDEILATLSFHRGYMPSIYIDLRYEDSTITKIIEIGGDTTHPIVVVACALRSVKGGRKRLVAFARTLIPVDGDDTQVVELRDLSLLEESYIVRGHFSIEWIERPILTDATSYSTHERYLTAGNLRRTYDEFDNRVPARYERFQWMRMRQYPLASGLTVPAALYMWLGNAAFSVDKTEVAFLEELCSAALRLNHLSEVRLINGVRRMFETGDWKGGDAPQILHATVTLLTIHANTMDYISDRTVGDEPCERMLLARNHFNCEDCEGLGKDAELIAQTIKRRVRLLHKLDDASTVPLRAMQQLLHMYVAVGVTGQVTSDSAANARGEIVDVRKMGNHAYSALVPRTFFLRSLREVDDEAVQRLSQGMARQHAFLPWERTEVPVLILEGTNWTDGMPLDPLRYATHHNEVLREHAARAATVKYLVSEWRDVLEHYSWEMQQKNIQFGMARALSPGEFSDFYRYVHTLWVDLRTYDPESTLIDLRCVDAVDGVYTVDYRDFVEMDERRFTLLPTYHMRKDRSTDIIIEALEHEQTQPEPLGPVYEKVPHSVGATLPRPSGTLQLRARGPIPSATLRARIEQMKQRADYVDEWRWRMRAGTHGASNLELRVLEVHFPN